MMDMIKPNLFKFATSELSQDAILCWLLSWASPEYRMLDQKLNECAVNLISSFFNKANIQIPSKIETVKVHKQWNYIDVICIVNEQFIILIEDKTSTSEHSGQLSRYLLTAKNAGFSDDKIIPIFYKTEEQSDLTSIEKDKFIHFSRTDMLSILNGYEGNSDILVDYREHLLLIQRSVDSYRVTPIDDWSWRAWQGFYNALKNRGITGDWGYVANPSGGFLGFWYGFQEDDICEPYIQLEQRTLCFKVSVYEKNDRVKARTRWYKKICEFAKQHDIDVVKPARFGNGGYMTVAHLKYSYRLTKNGVLDLDLTVEQLKKIEIFIKQLSLNSNLETC